MVDFTKRKAYSHEEFHLYFLNEGECREDLITDEEYWSTDEKYFRIKLNIDCEHSTDEKIITIS